MKYIFSCLSILVLTVGLVYADDDLQITNDVNYEVYISYVAEERPMQNRSFPANTTWSFDAAQTEDFGFRTIAIDTDSGTIIVQYPFPRPTNAKKKVSLSKIESAARTLRKQEESDRVGARPVSNEPVMIDDIAVSLKQ